MTAPEQHLVEAFLVLARTLHFGRAAKELHLTQSTISHRIRRLEQEIGVPLFDRTRRSVTLTAAGRALQEHARAATQELTRGVMEARRIASGDSGKLVVAHSGVASASGLLEALGQHALQSPGVTFEVRQASVAKQRQGILRGEIDLGCTFIDLPRVWAGFEVRDLPENELVAWIATDHPLAQRVSVSMSELCQERWIVLSAAAEKGFRDFLLDRGTLSQAPARAIEVDSLDACFEFVRRGIGVALIPGASLFVEGIRGIRIEPRIPTRSRVFWSDHSDNPVLTRYLHLLGVQ